MYIMFVVLNVCARVLGKIGAFLYPLQLIPRQNCKRFSKLWTQCGCTVTPIDLLISVQAIQQPSACEGDEARKWKFLEKIQFFMNTLYHIWEKFNIDGNQKIQFRRFWVGLEFYVVCWRFTAFLTPWRRQPVARMSRYDVHICSSWSDKDVEHPVHTDTVMCMFT